MNTVVLYITISTALYYLLARAKITQWLWSRFPAWLEYWTLCAACSGTFYCAGAAVVLGRHYDLPLLGFAGDHPLAIVVAGALGMVFTPIVAYLQVLGWSNLMETETTQDDPDTTADDLDAITAAYAAAISAYDSASAAYDAVTSEIITTGNDEKV
ncbi:hypothetical protein LCGC14_0522710 [marine sediment metagenome]|uniref:Uncharacterized protein n=1 Tax=marine sediment metagenome TaxID=412755 RepID=A0A0F9S2S6_9ZZZZ